MELNDPETSSPQKFVPIFTSGALNISATNPFGTLVASRDAAKSELISIIQNKAEPLVEFERFRIEYLTKYLESTHVPIQTGAFLSLAMGGTWTSEYTNALLPRADTTIACKIKQVISPGANHSYGFLCNKVAWAVQRENDAGSGELQVHSSYTVGPRGALSVSLVEHVLNIDKLPQDPEEVIMTLQRTIPFQYFDPDQITITTTYVDPHLRISRIFGPMFNSVFEIYCRAEEIEPGDNRVESGGDRKKAVV